MNPVVGGPLNLLGWCAAEQPFTTGSFRPTCDPGGATDATRDERLTSIGGCAQQGRFRTHPLMRNAALFEWARPISKLLEMMNLAEHAVLDPPSAAARLLAWLIDVLAAKPIEELPIKIQGEPGCASANLPHSSAVRIRGPSHHDSDVTPPESLKVVVGVASNLPETSRSQMAASAEFMS